MALSWSTAFLSDAVVRPAPATLLLHAAIEAPLPGFRVQ